MELTKHMLDYMQSLRRRLKNELGLNFKLSQDDVIPSMVWASFASRDTETQRQAQKLASLAEIDWKQLREQHDRRQAMNTQAPSVRIYRGQRVY